MIVIIFVFLFFVSHLLNQQFITFGYLSQSLLKYKIAGKFFVSVKQLKFPTAQMINCYYKPPNLIVV